MAKSKVAVIKVKPETILRDIERLTRGRIEVVANHPYAQSRGRA